MTYKITYTLELDGTPRLHDYTDLLICGQETEEDAAKYYAEVMERCLPSNQKAVNVKAFKQ